MRLYMAGLYTSHFNVSGNAFRRLTPNQRLLREQVDLKLESYHYLKKGRFVDNLRRDGERIFLDSGAYSALTQGVEIDLEEYAAFINEHQDIIEISSVLDAIGDADATWANQRRLEALGCAVLPCFHYGEPLDVLKYYAANYAYISIGGMVPVPNKKLKPWLDELWDKCLTDADGIAVTKVHGFGLTTPSLMIRYPWYSVDSSTWVQWAMNGGIALFPIDGMIMVSERSPTRKQFGRHYDTFPEESKKDIRSWLEYYGLSIEEVQSSYLPRWALNSFSFNRLGKSLGDDHWQKPFFAKQATLF